MFVVLTKQLETSKLFSWFISH